MPKLNTEAAYSIAKDFTLIAIENNMILASSEPEATAKDIALFYKTLSDELLAE